MEEVVVLVDEDDKELGTAPKESVHTTNTPLHRGFSLFLFNSKKELLLTKRAATKKTFPGVWTNTVCGHPGPGESVEDAAKRRIERELGLRTEDVRNLRVVAPYRYRFTDKNGVVENEICPILVGYCNTDPTPDPQEVDAWKWMPWHEFLEDIKKNPDIYSSWSREEASFIHPEHPERRDR